MYTLAVAYEDEALLNEAQALATRLNLPVDNQATNQLIVTINNLLLKISPFSPLHADFNITTWQKRHDAGKKQGLIRACKPKQGLRIIDATAGWGRDAAVLASFGAAVLMIERSPVIAALLNDALFRRDLKSMQALNLSLINQDAIIYLEALVRADYPDVIYIDPMHPPRQKSALVKKDLQILQHLIGTDEDALALIELARQRVLQRVVVKWPQQVPPLLMPSASIQGSTIRFDIYTPC